MIIIDKINPSSLATQGAVFTCIVITMFYIPYDLLFFTTVSRWQLWLDILLSSIFIVDLVMMVKGLPNVNDPRTKFLLKNLIPKWYEFNLAIGVMSCIPFIALQHYLGMPEIIKIISLIRIYRIIRMTKAFSIVGKVTVAPTWIKITLAITGSLIAIHLISCLWIVVSSLSEQNKSALDTYVHSVYWTITTLTTVGYGDITPTSNIGKIFTMFVMIMGVGVYGFVIGNISQILSDLGRHKDNVREKMQDLDSFLKYYHIPNKLRNTTFNYYNHTLEKRFSINDNNIISALPHALQEELQTYMNIKLIGSLSLFKGCSLKCLKEVSKHLTKKSYSPTQKIIINGEEGNEMYIIGHGTVEVYGKGNKFLTQLKEGDYFGEVALIEQTTRNADVIAQEYSDIYILSKKDFITVIDTYPELHAKIRYALKMRTAA